MQYNEKELADLISEVESGFSQALEKMEANDKTEMKKSEKKPTEEVQEVQKSEDLSEDDKKELDKLYAGMTKSEQKAHYESLAKHVAEESEMKKSEDTSEKPSEENDLVKAEIKDLKDQNESLKKSQEQLVGMLKDFFSKAKAPARKAVTGVDYIKKNEAENTNTVDVSSFSRKEINQKLSNKIRKGEIKKSEDREAINSFCLENASVETIKHLL